MKTESCKLYSKSRDINRLLYFTLLYFILETFEYFCQITSKSTHLQSVDRYCRNYSERIVVRQLMTYLTDADLLPPLQSGFRSGHFTESAVLCVLSGILLAVDRGDFAALVLLDLSAAFDTVDHDILLQRLESSFGIADVARDWFRSYLPFP